jgi:membrane-associated phospholipid phosphatase
MTYPLLLALVAFFEAETLAYLAVNRVASRLRNVSLFTSKDQILPPLPRSLWLYLSFFPYCFLAAFDGGNLRRTGRLLSCVALDALVSYRSFLKFPSTYPRPTIHDDDPGLEAAWRTLHEADPPANTFPSVHVGHSMLLALALSHHLPRQRSDALMLWASLITASTLTTKQHYLIDLAGGVVAAEAIVTHVYEPWEEGRLDWRTARDELGKLFERLDDMAGAPEQAWLRAADRHPRLREFLGTLASHDSLADLYASMDGRHDLLTQTRRLARLLSTSGRLFSLLTAPLPGSRKFARQFEAVVEQLSDRRLADYLRENEPELRRALQLLFELEATVAPAPAPAPTPVPASIPDPVPLPEAIPAGAPA